jgi:hypothetical protein
MLKHGVPGEINPGLSIAGAISALNSYIANIVSVVFVGLFVSA